MNINSGKCLNKLVLVFILSMTLALSGCGGGGDSAPQQNPPVNNPPSSPVSSPISQIITGGGIKGPLANAFVTIFAFDTTQPGFKGSAVTTAATDATAVITGLNLPLPLNPPYIMEFTSVPATTDITTGISPVIATIRTVITQALLNSDTDIYATPLTTLAVDIAVMNAADTNATAGIQVDEFEAALVLAASKVISTMGFGLDGSVDIFNTPPLINSATISITEQANVARYRTAIEAITAIAYQISQQSAGVTADAVLADFAADLADDDIINGTNGSTLNSNTLRVLQQNPSSLPIPNTSPLQTVADVQAVLAAETAVTGSATDTTRLLDGTIVTKAAPAKTKVDSDGDGVFNADDDLPDNQFESVDSDGDGIGDNADRDDDNDGILDEDEGLSSTPAVNDTDGDGIVNGIDNCPDNFNPAQTNSDIDAEGDACDLDDDGDGVIDTDDAFPNDASKFIDTDSDGIDDGTDADDDNDGISDGTDVGVSQDGFTSCSLLVDCDGDGVLDGVDADRTDPGVGLNFGPVAHNDVVTVNEDEAVFLIDVTANDIDTTVILTGFGINDTSLGILATSGNSIEYTPVANSNGTDTFTYTVTDGTFSSQGSVTVTIVAVNDSPVANDDTAITNEDSAVVIADVTVNDVDADGDALTAMLQTNASNGQVVDSGNGTFTYTPGINFYGTDSFTYTLSDVDSTTADATGTVSITVNPVNDNPLIADDFVSTNEDSNVTTGNVLLNDSDIDSNVLSVVAGNPVAANGTVVNNNNGTFSYTPNVNFNGSDSFSYMVTDGNGGSAIGTVNITINAVNDNPLANADSVTTNEGVVVITTDVTLNDTDIDGDSLTVAAGNPVAANGTVVNNNNGTFSYTPNANYNGSDSFSYTVTDGNGGSAIGTVSITINPVNNNPVANADAVSTDEDVAVLTGNVTLNDTDIDGDALAVVAGDPVAANGSVVNNNNGTFSYTPNTNYNGSDSFSYTVTDGRGGSASGTVSITINVVNDNPVANADAVTTGEDSSVTTADIRLNDTDIEGDVLLVVSGNPVAANGSVLNNSNGTFTYTPNANFNGSDIFTYTLSDGKGGTATGIVNVTITPINDNPAAVNDAITTNENTVVTTADVRLNDTDIDGDTLTATLMLETSNGSVVDNNNGTFTYTPNANFNGSDSFTYTLSDGQGGSATGTVVVTINPVSNAPVANTDTAITDEDVSVITVDVRLNDTDSDNNLLTVTLQTNASNGSVVDSGNGTFTYTPGINFNGTDSFTYTLSDGDSTTADATGMVSITVNPVNDNPVANADSVSTDEDSSVTTADATLNDTDIDSNTLTVVAGNPIATNGTVVNNNNGTFNYTPNTNFNGSDSFTYSLSDGNGGSATGTVNITVNAVNDNPVANADSATTNEDVVVLTTDVTLNDTDIDGDSLAVAAGNPVAANGTVVNNNNGTFSYTPNANYNGSDSFSYTVTDGKGGSAIGTVSITVNPVNNNPVTNTDSVTTNEDSNVTTADVTLNDSDIDGDTLAVVAGNPVAANGTVVNHNNGTFTYTPNANYNGGDSFTYIISDGNGGNASGTVSITINAVNDNPVANADSATTNEDVVVLTADVTLNDTDIDGDGLAVAAGNPVAANGTVVNNNNGTFSYTPNANYNGSDSFSYTVTDGKGGSAIGTVNITVSTINDTPVAVNDSAVTVEDASVITGDVRLNDADADNDPLTATLLANASSGNVVDNGNATFKYTPNANFNGSDSFSYTLSDGKGGSVIGTVSITVNAVNDNPVANADIVVLDEDGSVIIADVRSNDTDVENDPLTVVLLTNAANGIVLDNNDGTFSYTPNANFSGSDSFSYTLSDGIGGSAIGTVTITVNSINDNPVANNDSVVTDEDVIVISADVRSNDVDIDGDSLTISPGNPAATNGTVINNNNGTFTYTANANYNGSDSFSYTLNDGNGGSDIGTVNITVNAVNDNPIANADAVTTDEDVAVLTGDVVLNDTDIDGDAMAVVAGNPVATSGTVVNNNNGTFSYTPNANFNGSDSFDYTVIDGKGGSATGTVNITVNPVKDNPVAINDAISTNEDVVVITGDVRINDSDADGDPLSVTLLANASNGNVVDNNNGTFTYTPGANFNGADSFTYTLSDGNTGTAMGTVNITVNPVNDLPVGNADSFTVDATTPTVLDVLANDADADGTLTISNVSQGSLGSTVSHNGSVITFTDINNATGTETFSYDVTDGTAIVTGINVVVNIIANSPNTPPVANDDNVTTTIDKTFFFNVLANDSDLDGDVLSVSLPAPNTPPTNGLVSYNGSGTFTYSPNTGFIGTDSFTYTVTDSIDSAVGTVTITVTPPGTPIDMLTLMSAVEGGVAGIENAEANVYAYWTDNYNLANSVFLPEDRVYNHLTGVFDTVVNNGDLLLSGTQWVSEGGIIGTDDGNGGLDLTILDANNINVEVARFKLTARFQDLNNVRISDHLHTAWQLAMVNPNTRFNAGAKLLTDYRFEALVESHVLGQDNSCQKDGTTKFTDLNGNCNSVDVDVTINASGYAQLLNDVVATTAWLDPNDGFSTPPGAITIATNNLTNRTLMVQLVNGGAANYYVVDWNSNSDFAFVANAVAGADWLQNTGSGVDMIHFQVPASFITQFSGDLGNGLNNFLTVQNGYVRQGLKHAIGDSQFSDGQFNGNAFADILANFSAPVIPGLAELTGTWVNSVASTIGDPALIHIFANGIYESSGSCDLDGSTGMEYGTVSSSGSATNIIALAQIATQGLCGPAQGNKTLAVNGDVLTLSEPGFADVVYNRLLGTLNPIVGSWLLGNIQDPGEAHTILTMLDDNTFTLSQDCTADSVSGFEYGTYSWDQGTNILMGTLTIDSNASCGLNTALSISGFTVTVLGDTLTLTDAVGGSFVYTRISPAYVEPMLQVVYILDNLMLQPGDGQITGTFTWSYVAGDFAGGSGQFTDLNIPGYGTDIAGLNINFDIEVGIEITLAVNTNNIGLTIILNFVQPLSPTAGSPIDLVTSSYEIEVNGLRIGSFVSGAILIP